MEIISPDPPPGKPEGAQIHVRTGPALTAFAELVASRRDRDVRRTLLAQRRLRDEFGHCVALTASKGRGRR